MERVSAWLHHASSRKNFVTSETTLVKTEENAFRFLIRISVNAQTILLEKIVKNLQFVAELFVKMVNVIGKATKNTI